MTDHAADATASAATGRPRAVVRTDQASDWTVEQHVFAKFTEMNGREGYPGIYSEYLANGSFEEWYTWPKRTPAEDPPWWRRSEALYPDVERVPGVAYPWEPTRSESARATFDQGAGGVHGRGETGRDRTDVHGRTYREPERRYQRVTIWEGRAGVAQRTAIPDRRTDEFEVAVSVRGEGLETDCRVRLTTLDGTVLAETTVPVEADWDRHTCELRIDGEPGRYRDSPFGAVELSFSAAGRGHLDLDHARLRAGDAVEGKFNPTTIENIQEYGVSSLRWPGGNFTSQYHWEDGIGPVADRPVRSELQWGGLEPNFLGTDEFLEFCEVAGIEPYLNVGFSEEIGPEEAARWVEYCNGDPEETEMGTLRAENGHEEPWDIDVFQVGNEVWGTFQIGHTDPRDYGERFVEYYEAIKEIDPDVTVYAVGCEPGLEKWDGAAWNEGVLETAGDVIEGLDLHRYVHGDAGDRAWDEYEFNQQLVLYPTQFEANLEGLLEVAAERGVEDLELDVGEWNMGAGGLETGRRADYGTTAHAAFCAGMYNAFVRQGDAVKWGFQRDNAFKHRPFRSDTRPMWTANNAVMKLYTDLYERHDEWHYVPTDVEGPTADVDQHGIDVEAMENVPLLDSVTLRDGDGAEQHCFLTNRSLTTPQTVRVDVGRPADAVEVTTVVADDPLDDTTEWDGETSYRVETERHIVEDGEVDLPIPPAGVVRVSATD